MTNNREHLLQLSLLIGPLAIISALFAGTLGHVGGFLVAQAWSNTLPPLFWECVTVLGDERVLFALFLPFAMRYPRAFFAILLSAALAGLLSRGIKLWAALPRPASVLPAELITVIGPRVTRHALPSGHTASLFAFVGVLIGLSGCRRYRVALLLLAVLAGFSRVAVGAHWPLDVMVGALVGLVAAWLALMLQHHCRWQVGPGLQAVLVTMAVVSTLTLPLEGQGYDASLPIRLAVFFWALCGVWLATRQRQDAAIQPAVA